MIKGLLAELDENGNTKEGGIQVEGAVLMPTYMKNDDQKAIFNGAKVNDVLVFNPATAFDNNEAELSSLLKIKKEEVADVKGNFSFQVEEITRMVPAELNQELFDQVFGKDTVKSEEEFRAKIKEGIAVQFEADSNYKFLMDVRDYLTKRVGKLEFPDALLKRIMLLNNEEKGEAFVAENYEKSIEELTWHLIKEQLIAANEIMVEQADVLNMAKEATRLQFAQYGMLNIPEEMLENYAKELLKKKGAKVTMTRVKDVDVYGVNATDAQELQARVDVAENSAADLFISLHINASDNKNVGGFSSYYYPKTSHDARVATAIQKRMTNNFGLDDLGIRQANFYVNKRSSMPSALIEMAFITNAKEEKLLNSNWFQSKLAKAIADGIEDYFK